MTRTAERRDCPLSRRGLVSGAIVRRDLKRWEELHVHDASVSHLLVKKMPLGGCNVTAGCDSGDTAVMSLRRIS